MADDKPPCPAFVCLRKDGIICPDDSCDIEDGIVTCMCERGHDRPYWRCPIHGYTTVDH